jgi:hypothetical protein
VDWWLSAIVVGSYLAFSYGYGWKLYSDLVTKPEHKKHLDENIVFFMWMFAPIFTLSALILLPLAPFKVPFQKFKRRLRDYARQ